MKHLLGPGARSLSVEYGSPTNCPLRAPYHNCYANISLRAPYHNYTINEVLTIKVPSKPL